MSRKVLHNRLPFTQLTTGRSGNAQTCRIDIVSQIAEDNLLQVHTEPNQNIFDIRFQFVDGRLFIRMRPIVIHTATAHPQAQTIFFREFGQCFTFLLMVDIVIVAVSEFKETDIAILAFRIMFDTFQASEQQRLAHAIQISAQRIHQHHTVRNRISGKMVIVSRACQRVIQNLIETATAKLFGNQVLQFITAVGRSLITQIGLHIVTEFHIIISVNTENIFDHVNIALYIDTIYGHIDHQTFSRFGNDLHFQAIQNALDRFNRNHSYGVITTHYQNLKHFAEDTEGIVNGAMLYDRHLMQPLFKLSIGNPGSSFAVEIARKIGLPEDVIADASANVGSDYINMDKYLQDIVRDKRYWESKRQNIRQQEKKLEDITARYEQDLEAVNKQRKEIMRNAKEEAQRILSEANAKIENTIREIKEAQAEKEQTKLARKALEEFKASVIAAEEEDDKIARKMAKLQERKERKKQKQNAPASKQIFNRDVIEAGDNVRLKGQVSAGTVMEVQGKQAIVAFGMIKSTVKLEQLEKVSKGQIKKEIQKSTFVSAQTTDDMHEKRLNFKQEIDVRGMRGDEALQAVTYFVDDAIQVGAARIRILHGPGTGILRQLIRDYLHTVPGVRQYHDEHVQFGGAGITVVELE